MKIRSSKMSGLVVVVSAGALMASGAMATTSANAGEKITKSSFGIHSFVEDPGVRAGTIRMNMWPNWRQLNPAKGQYDWPLMDQTIATVKSWGFKDVLYVFGNTPQWAAGPVMWPDRELEPGSTAAPSKMKYWKNFATKLVKKYKKDIDHYQAWNEITSPQFYQGTAKQMAKMTKILNTIVNKYDKSATVVSGSVQTHAQAYYDRMATPYFAALRAKGWPVDVVSGHFYPTGKGGPDKRISQINMFKNDVNKYGRPGRVKMWDTEANFWTTVPNKVPPNPNGRVRGKKAATYVARNYLDTWRTGLKRSYWYMWTVGAQDLGFPGIQMRSDLAPARVAYNRLADWTIGSKYQGCSTKGTLVQCTFKKGGKFQVVFTTSGRDKLNVGNKTVCPVYSGSCRKGKGTISVGTLPLKVG